MKRWLAIPMLLIAPLMARGAAKPTDARALVQQSIQNYEHDWHEGIRWTYIQTDAMRKDEGKLTEVSAIGPLFGTPYERLVSRDGKLPPDLKKHEEEKFQKAYSERESESPEKRAARIRKYDGDRAFFSEIPQAYDFEIVAEPVLDGRPTWEIKMTPHQGYVPKNSRAGLLRHIQGKLWIDKEDVRWAKAQAEVTETASIGWIVARVGPGAKFELDQVRVRPDFWMPRVIDVKAVARVMMLHNKDLTEHLTYSDYRLEKTPEMTTHSKDAAKANTKNGFK